MSKRSSLFLVLVLALFAAIGLGGCGTQERNAVQPATPSDAQPVAPTVAGSRFQGVGPSHLEKRRRGARGSRKSMMRSSARDLPPRVATA